MSQCFEKPVRAARIDLERQRNSIGDFGPAQPFEGSQLMYAQRATSYNLAINYMQHEFRRHPGDFRVGTILIKYHLQYADSLTHDGNVTGAIEQYKQVIELNQGIPPSKLQSLFPE